VYLKKEHVPVLMYDITMFLYVLTNQENTFISAPSAYDGFFFFVVLISIGILLIITALSNKNNTSSQRTLFYVVGLVVIGGVFFIWMIMSLITNSYSG
jgi:hypothetical protein